MKKILDFIRENNYIVIAGVFLAVLILIFGIISFRLTFSAKLDVLVVPADASVLINGKEYDNGVYENLQVGKAKVSISKEGFDSQEFEIELKRNEETRLYTYLEGNEEWYDSADTNTQYLLDIINEYRGEQQTVELLNKYPIMKSVPIVIEKFYNNYTEYISYRIDGGIFEGCEKEFCLKITDISGGNYERALQTIRDKGYDADDYEIIYEDASTKGHAGRL